MGVMLITSCLFGTVVLHAFWKRHSLIHFLTLGQTMLSLLHYGMNPPHPSIRALDMGFALSFFCQGLYQLVKEKSKLVFVVWLVGLLYAFEILIRNEKYKLFIHALLHAVACIGLHIYLYFYWHYWSVPNHSPVRESHLSTPLDGAHFSTCAFLQTFTCSVPLRMAYFLGSCEIWESFLGM